jgi:hypothetical protein
MMKISVRDRRRDGQGDGGMVRASIRLRQGKLNRNGQFSRDQVQADARPSASPMPADNTAGVNARRTTHFEEKFPGKRDTGIYTLVPPKKTCSVVSNSFRLLD